VNPLSRYWQFVTLDTTGERRIETMTTVKSYLCQEFQLDSDRVSNDTENRDEITDAIIQSHLWKQMHRTINPSAVNSSAVNPADQNSHPVLAETALRCYISGQVDHGCRDLASRFGRQHGFTSEDLLSFVLDDLRSVGRSNSPYQSVATQVLQSFDVDRGALSTWVHRHFKQQPDLKKFLLQQGVYLITDWALLNDTNPPQLGRILQEYYQTTRLEQAQAMALLNSYHAIYRADRMAQREKVGRTPCPAPTPEQLARIQSHLQQGDDAAAGRSMSGESILKQLQSIAAKLRQARIVNQGGQFKTVSIDQPDSPPIAEQLYSSPAEDPEQLSFLRFYQAEFDRSLDDAVAAVVTRMSQPSKRKGAALPEVFLQAMQQFHCEGRSMSEIAPKIGLKKQYEVTRLLKLNDLRADVRQTLLRLLKPKILDKAQQYADVEQLTALDQQVETILDEQIGEMMQAAESEAKQPIRHQPLRNLLAQRICRYLDQYIPALGGQKT
jgi:hypothetical protein